MTCTPRLSIKLLHRFVASFGPLPSKMPGYGTGSGKSAEEEAGSPLLCRLRVLPKKWANLVLQAKMRRGKLARND